jgi:hypothetical protein
VWLACHHVAHEVVVLYAEDGRPSTGLLRELGERTGGFGGLFDGCAVVVAIFDSGQTYRFSVDDNRVLRLTTEDGDTILVEAPLVVLPPLRRCPLL